MKNSPNIILIGFMGSGKTSTSKVLARLLERSCVSTDDKIVDWEGRTIAQIFEVRGEPYFRSLERRAVAELSDKSALVIDCGGGVVKDPANIADLKTNGILVHLKTSPEWILRRTKDVTKRPLLDVPDPLARIEKLLKERASMYAQAEITVDTDGKTPEQVAREIVSLLKNL